MAQPSMAPDFHACPWQAFRLRKRQPTVRGTGSRSGTAAGLITRGGVPVGVDPGLRPSLPLDGFRGVGTRMNTGLGHLPYTFYRRFYRQKASAIACAGYGLGLTRGYLKTSIIVVARAYHSLVFADGAMVQPDAGICSLHVPSAVFKGVGMRGHSGPLPRSQTAGWDWRVRLRVADDAWPDSARRTVGSGSLPCQGSSWHRRASESHSCTQGPSPCGSC